MLTENISVRLVKLLLPAFPDIITRLVYVTATAISRITKVLIVYFTILGAISFEKKILTRVLSGTRWQNVCSNKD
jgi:hypothetical protein